MDERSKNIKDCSSEKDICRDSLMRKTGIVVDFLRLLSDGMSRWKESYMDR